MQACPQIATLRGAASIYRDFFAVLVHDGHKDVTEEEMLRTVILKIFTRILVTSDEGTGNKFEDSDKCAIGATERRGNGFRQVTTGAATDQPPPETRRAVRGS